MPLLVNRTRHKCFISYHHADEVEVEQFVQDFDHNRDVLIAQGIGAGMSGDIINSTNADYIKSQIRAKYLLGTTVTIVLVGRETWGRKFVDWEVGASLRNTAATSANGLLAITLPSAADHEHKQLPARVSDNVSGANGDQGYARWWKYPSSTESLGRFIETAYAARTDRADVRNNARPLRMRNA